jgi:hypothetical protein
MTQFLTSADVAKIIDRTPAAVRLAAIKGYLRVASTTGRGVRLFVLDDVLAYRARLDAARHAKKVAA